MGCTNTREGKPFTLLAIDCNELMLRNLEILTIIEYLLIKKNKTSTALAIFSIRKETKDFYDVTANHRQFWIIKAKNTMQNGSLSIEGSRCLNEQNKEKKELQKCTEVLESHLDSLSPN